MVWVGLGWVGLGWVGLCCCVVPNRILVVPIQNAKTTSVQKKKTIPRVYRGNILLVGDVPSNECDLTTTTSMHR